MTSTPPPSSVRDVVLLDVSVLEMAVLEVTVPPGTDMSPAARYHYNVIGLICRAALPAAGRPAPFNKQGV